MRSAEGRKSNPEEGPGDCFFPDTLDHAAVLFRQIDVQVTVRSSRTVTSTSPFFSFILSSPSLLSDRAPCAVSRSSSQRPSSHLSRHSHGHFRHFRHYLIPSHPSTKLCAQFLGAHGSSKAYTRLCSWTRVVPDHCDRDFRYSF
jgi:hypothetical protein